MTETEIFSNSLFRDLSPVEFNDLALKIFHFQYKNNTVYRSFIDALKTDTSMIRSYQQVPFLPISFYKDHRVICGAPEVYDICFQSSGTTGMSRSCHYIKDKTLYEESFTRTFEHFFGPVSDYVILALLPSYLEQEHSSLIYMISRLIERTNNTASSFYKYDFEKLLKDLKSVKPGKNKVILWGVTYALLDMAERYSPDLNGVIVMETGGMKGRRKEIVREELHDILCRSFKTEAIGSEYGMTELLSQAYSFGNGIFRSPPWMKIIARDINDPLSLVDPGKTGGLNVIDLANIHSCSFIATQDLGKVYPDGSFEVLGRFDDSDVRGCNLLYG